MDTIQVSVTFTRAVFVHGMERNFTASLTLPWDEYVAKTPEELEAWKMEKVGKYVAAVETEEARPDAEAKTREVSLIDRQLADLADLKARDLDGEIADLRARRVAVQAA